MRLGFFVLVAACYAPKLQAGSPCDQGPCPAGLVCSPASLTCELVAIDAATVHDTLRDGCTPKAEICGNGIDEDCDGNDAPCPANDAPSGAIDVSAGGTFTANLTYANDDAAQIGCGGAGGRDVFYEITLAKAEVIYLDTFGSDFATDVRVYAGKDCLSLAGMPNCNHDQCGGKQSQVALQLPGGTTCIVVDQDADETHGALTLNVKRGGRTGNPLAGGTTTYTGDTCSGTNQNTPPQNCVTGDSNTSSDISYFYTVCPSQTRTLDASTCADATQTHFDTIMYVRPVGTPSLACNDDGATCTARTERPGQADGSILTNVVATGPNLFFLTVDGYGGACGGYQLVTNFH